MACQTVNVNNRDHNAEVIFPTIQLNQARPELINGKCIIGGIYTQTRTLEGVGVPVGCPGKGRGGQGGDCHQREDSKTFVHQQVRAYTTCQDVVLTSHGSSIQSGDACLHWRRFRTFLLGK